MKIIKNDGLIKRNGRIGQYTSLAALAVLGVGMYISFRRQDLFVYSVGALLLGFTMTQIGMYFSNRWGRSPRPDEQLDGALKGLPGDTTLYHYMTPVSHLLVGSPGVWILKPYHQRGKLTYARGRWRLSGGGFVQGYMSIFGQESIGRPDIDSDAEVKALQRFLAKNLENADLPEIHTALVFTNDSVEISADGAPLPALKGRQLKDFLRQRVKERTIPSTELEKIRSALPQE
jgi:hypothetical protein